MNDICVKFLDNIDKRSTDFYFFFVRLPFVMNLFCTGSIPLHNFFKLIYCFSVHI